MSKKEEVKSNYELSLLKLLVKVEVNMPHNDCGLAIGLALIARQAPKPKPNIVTEDEDNN